jgi:hypothetical protein
MGRLRYVFNAVKPRILHRSHGRYQIMILLSMWGLLQDVSYYTVKISVGFAHFILIIPNSIKFFPFDEQKTTIYFVKLTATQPQLWRL